MAHVMSKGFAVKAPEDLKGKKPLVWRDDMVRPILFQVIGGVTSVPLSIPEVLPNLNTGAIDVVIAPPLVTEQLQWAPKVDTLVEDVAGAAIGAVIFSSDRLNKLPADLRAIVIDTGKIAAAALTKRIRELDNAAFSRLKEKLTVVKLSADEQNKWSAVFKQARGRLAQGTFAPQLVSKLEALAK
jgi:TRAP-type transport system periplasmic protein